MGTRAVVATVVVLGVLVGGAAVADNVARDRAEDRIASELQSRVDGLDQAPDVEIGGFPFLTQLMAGELQDVTGTADAATLEGVEIQQIEADLDGVSTDRPTTAEQVWLRGLVPLAGIEEAVGMPIEADAENGTLSTGTEVLSVPLEITLVPRAAGQAIEIDVESLSLAGATVGIDSLPGAIGDQLQGLSFDLPGLPDDLDLTELVVEADGIRVTAEGTDVTFDELP